jgi:hypothetical protein
MARPWAGYPCLMPDRPAHPYRTSTVVTSGERAGILLLTIAFAACGSSSDRPTDSDGVDASSSPDGTSPAGSSSGGSSEAGASGGEGGSSGGSGGGSDASSPHDAGILDASVASDASAEAGTTLSLYVTFYGWVDNSPPGNAIAYPKSDGYPTVHDGAGGTGTYADPITFATDKAEFAPGTRLYLPFAQKYAMMEDDCVECDSDWTSSHKRHVDVWMNSNGSEMPSALLDCEDQWTMNAATVEVSPPEGRTVAAAPLFDPATNTCRATP